MQKRKMIQEEKKGFLRKAGRKIGTFFLKLLQVSALVFGLFFLGLWAGNSIWETKLDSQKGGGSIIIGKKPMIEALTPKPVPLPMVEKTKKETIKSQREIQLKPKRDRIEFNFSQESESDAVSEVVEEPVYENPVSLEPEFMRVVQKKGQYRVQKNDTWYAISQKFNVSRDDLQRVNDGSDFTIIRPGEVIWIPQIVMMAQATAVSYKPTIFSKMRRSIGRELSLAEADQIAQWAAAVTGAPAKLVLAISHRESELGKNIGKCHYKKVMRKREQKSFLRITRKLGLHPDHTPVSCPNGDGVYGGAMGTNQIMPTTWERYESRIARITGNNQPSPWRHEDAYVGTGLYLKDSITSDDCREYGKEIPRERKKLLQRCAAAKYYAGNNWHKFRWKYGEPVVRKAEELSSLF